jgi:hypothetical protein
MLRPPDSLDPERILTIGSFGAGKTHAWMEIAAISAASGSDARFYAIDTDKSVRRMSKDPRYGNAMEFIDVYPADRWEDMKGAAEGFLPRIRPAIDWVVVDFMGTAWEYVQDWYTRKMFDATKADFFMNAKQAGVSGNPLDGWKDWTYINAQYNQFKDMVFMQPGHLYLTAQADSISDTDDSQIKGTFGAYGVKPKGQKALGFPPHTVLLMSAWRPGEWKLTTIKDRARQPFHGEVLTSFTQQYLIGRGGWLL